MAHIYYLHAILTNSRFPIYPIRPSMGISMSSSLSNSLSSGSVLSMSQHSSMARSKLFKQDLFDRPKINKQTNRSKKKKINEDHRKTIVTDHNVWPTKRTFPVVFTMHGNDPIVKVNWGTDTNHTNGHNGNGRHSDQLTVSVAFVGTPQFMKMFNDLHDLGSNFFVHFHHQTFFSSSSGPRFHDAFGHQTVDQFDRLNHVFTNNRGLFFFLDGGSTVFFRTDFSIIGIRDLWKIVVFKLKQRGVDLLCKGGAFVSLVQRATSGRKQKNAKKNAEEQNNAEQRRTTQKNAKERKRKMPCLRLRLVHQNVSRYIQTTLHDLGKCTHLSVRSMVPISPYSLMPMIGPYSNTIRGCSQLPNMRAVKKKTEKQSETTR